MNEAALSLLRSIGGALDALRTESADQWIEILERLDRLEQMMAGRTVPRVDAAAETLLAAAFERFGEVPFLAFELTDWCRPCADKAQRDAYSSLCALCEDKDPTAIQAGKKLGELAEGYAGEWRVRRAGERHHTALWGVIPPSPGEGSARLGINN